MRLERIDSIFDFEKGTLQSTKCDPGEFDFITASREWKTHKDFTHDKEALIIAVAASGSLGRTHYANGKFTASDLCFILTPKDGTADDVSLPFYQFVFNGLKQDLVKKCATGTAKQAINRQNFSSYLLPLFAPDEQERMAEKLRWAFESQEALESEITHQQFLVGKLKQAVLQEAIQGKLTADWRAANPDVEPASELLQRIQAEKARLIAEKKIRKEKPLPEITPEEIPFEIPDGWEWCRLGQIVSFSSGDGLTAAKMAGGEIPVFGGNGINGYHNKPNIDKETVVVGRVGANCGAVHKTPKTAWVTDNAFITRYAESCFSMDFIVLLLRFLDLNHLSYDGSQPVISGKRVYPLLTPLIPLAEQAAIVERVEALMATCRELEAEIERSRTHAADLLQAVLKEAFAPAANDN